MSYIVGKSAKHRHLSQKMIAAVFAQIAHSLFRFSKTCLTCEYFYIVTVSRINVNKNPPAQRVDFLFSRHFVPNRHISTISDCRLSVISRFPFFCYGKPI